MTKLKANVTLDDKGKIISIAIIPPKSCWDKAFDIAISAIIVAFWLVCGGIIGYFIGVLQ